jgi:hypothetical protein
MAAGRDWDRLAEFTRERRVDLGMTQEDVRAAGGPSTATMRLIEGALQSGYQPSTLRDLEKVLRWERGSVNAILSGGDPVPAGPALAPATRPTGVRVIDEAATDAELAPFIWQIEREVEEAERRYGPDPAGEQIFGPGDAANAWNSPIWDRDTTIRMLATFRLFAFQNRGGQAGSKTGLSRFRILAGSP